MSTVDWQNARTGATCIAVLLSLLTSTGCNDGVSARDSRCSVTGTCPDPLVPSVGGEDGGSVCRCVELSTVSCGNQRVEPGEGCDDGNTTAGDGCFNCQIGDCATGELRDCGPVEKDGIGACHKGTQRCISGVWESACPGAVAPTPESCNAIDDDCDGVVDEDTELTYYPDLDGDGFGSSADGGASVHACRAPSGFSPTNNDCDDTPGSGALINPSRDEQCDSQMRDENCNGESNEGCGCPAVGDQRACCGSRGTQSCLPQSGGAQWGPCSVQGTPEICNGMDDDCDTVSDNAPTDGGSLCPFSGQVCSGACSCPSGLVLCGGACVQLSQACMSGVGACQQSGSIVCQNNTASCNAAPRDAGVESCNGIDDDCDGMTDEGTFISCYPDADGDKRAANATVTMKCPDFSRSAYGNCPSGFIAPTAAVATNDCLDSNSSIWQLLSVRVDGDADGYCTSAGATNECSGAGANGGKRLASSCQGVNDECDNNGGAYRNVTTRVDFDHDGYCAGNSTTTACYGASLPGDRIVSTGCNGTDDCNDGNNTLQIYRGVANDTDGDRFCTSGDFTSCESATGDVWSATGHRLGSSCVSRSDCRPGNPNFGNNCNEIVQDSPEQGHCCCFGCGEPNPVQRTHVSSCPTGYKLDHCAYNKLSGMGTNVITGADGVGSSSYTCYMEQYCSGCDGTRAILQGICVPCDTQSCP